VQKLQPLIFCAWKALDVHYYIHTEVAEAQQIILVPPCWTALLPV
jgi:hypothetical protein